MSPAGSDRISIMDTTLRDGEQTPNVAYTPVEKLQIAKFLLTEVGVDRIEIASTRVSQGEMEGARLISAWARETGMLDRVEVLGFCDGGRSVQWIIETGGRTLNLLAKGSERHCRTQLRLTPEEHRARVAETITAARAAGVAVNIYLEDWSNGVQQSFSYVSALVDLARELKVARVFLPDTLGVLSPDGTARWVGAMHQRWPDLIFEFHGHNDYGLATANCLAALRSGATGVHTSVNGLGERAGNSSLAEAVIAIHDHTDFRTGVDETRLSRVAHLVEAYSGKELAANAPVVGRDVFTQTAGVHADGDAKGDLYVSRLEPGRLGRERSYALGKLSGKASLDQNLKILGIELPEADKALVLRRIIELGDRKHIIGSDDLPHVIADVLQTPTDKKVAIDSYNVAVGNRSVPRAEIAVSRSGRRASSSSTGAGGYDALMRALTDAARQLDLTVPVLVDFRVRIPPGGQTEALVETRITWRAADAAGEWDTFSTVGVDADQIAAAMIATEKMLNLIAT